MKEFRPVNSSCSLAERFETFPFFGGISAAGQRLLCDRATPSHFGADDLLLTEGNECQALLLVERGGIRVYKISPSGREITLYTVEPGESCVLGTSCVVNRNDYPALAATRTATDALAIPADVFRYLYENESAVRTFVMSLFSRRFSHLMLLVEEVAFARMDERLASLLLDHAVAGPGLLRPICMSHDEIAAHLGTAREVVSRLLQQFADQGVLRLARKRIEVVDPARLQELSGREKRFS